MPQIITTGVSYRDFLNDCRAVFRQEIQEQLKDLGHLTSQPTIGGIDLACEVTGLTKNTIYALCSRRGIPYSKPAGGSKLYFNRAELLEWIASGRREQQKTR
ncbi:helix-turn-helix domain-containing protein [Hymenobacter sp. ISL-91]|uniref:helix-turn-helix domain-containing protein n=1 Tax=Hymenobacter sp. ISL-91 TaxID=2819151 RepID=UPI001BEA9942|nr:helix-turn-helix domain-containing protein [Hymenobacter sp. ISL-91]MBT2557564.1 helix-turn-helix domain-containing protein [Hymenobacter sp. ISL-91]